MQNIEEILEKYGECEEVGILKMVIYHFEMVQRSIIGAQEKGRKAFPDRFGYQKFQVSKLFSDQLKFHEHTLDPSLKGFKTYRDLTLPPLDAFGMSSDMKETRKLKFLKNVDKGDILHLKVVGEDAHEYKFLVLNKYNDNERVADYLIYAYMVKAHRVQDLPIPLQINTFIRAAVFGKLKQEKHTFSKLLVTFNSNIVREKYKDVYLGAVQKSSIPFYPEDISNYSNFVDYMKATHFPDDHEDMIKCMSSLGIDPYRTYSYRSSSDRKKLGQPKNPSSVDKKSQELSMNLVREVENQIIRARNVENQVVRAGVVENEAVDPKSLLPMLDKALEICPNNDAAYAVRGQLYKFIFVREQEFGYIIKALEDLQKAFTINGYNLIATREYLSLLLLSADLYKEEGDKTKSEEIMKKIVEYKEICDVNFSEGQEEMEH